MKNVKRVLMNGVVGDFYNDMCVSIDGYEKAHTAPHRPVMARSTLVTKTLKLIQMDRAQVKARMKLEDGRAKITEQMEQSAMAIHKSVWFHGPDDGKAFY